MTGTLAWRVAPGDTASAARAETLGVTVVDAPPKHGFYLQQSAAGLTLRHAAAAANDAGLRLDFLAAEHERRHAGGRQSALARAFGLHRHPPMSVFDSTCGLGRDSVTLAALGSTVTACERHPALYALLDDARQRAATAPHIPDWLACWQALYHADAQNWLPVQTDAAFDAIYIDPMFDAPRRKARPQKALAWLGELVGVDRDAGTLLTLARGHARRRVVVKQHARAPALAEPDLQVHAKAVRFDIYLTPPDAAASR